MHKYEYKKDVIHDWVIFVNNSEADSYHRDTDYLNPKAKTMGSPNDEGGIVGTSEWIWISDENARRICAALEYFRDTPTDEIVRLAFEKIKERTRKRRTKHGDVSNDSED